MPASTGQKKCTVGRYLKASPGRPGGHKYGPPKPGGIPFDPQNRASRRKNGRGKGDT